MIKAIALDDEPPALKVLQKHALQFGKIELVACFTQPTDALAFLNLNNVALVFLDIRLKQHSGIDIAARLKNKYAVIFTTAYIDYALQGYDLDVVDYLLKPISYRRFADACNKLLDRHRPVIHHLVVKEGNCLHKIDSDTILFLEAAGNYVKVHTTGKTWLCRDTLANMLARLPAGNFTRTHKGFVVHKARVTMLRPTVALVNEIEIPVSSFYRKEVLEAFANSWALK